MKTQAKNLRFCFYSAKAVFALNDFSSRNIDILLRQKSSNLHPSDEVSGWLLTEVGAKRF
ncbi:MAG: hypothetical protein KBS45_04705 [Clostridiales bacterium]|nr:hypothetical protein [Candidatus Coliplasma caballi]